MTLRRLTIALSAFLLLAAILAGVWAWWARRQMGPRLAPIVITLPDVPDDNGYDVLLSATKLYVDTGVDLSTTPGVPITDGQRSEAIGFCTYDVVRTIAHHEASARIEPVSIENVA